MNLSNHPVTSREYKLMLNTDRFKNREQGSGVFLRLIDFLIRKEGGNITEKQDKEERRKTSYLDTPELAMRQQGFSLRLREELKEDKSFQINLKYRASDRYIAAARDLSGTQKSKTKFEEDVLPPFVSKFSHSASIETKNLPGISNMKEAASLFPGLEKLHIDSDTAVKIINDFTALEVVRKLCKFQFEDALDIKACLSFWYLTEEDNWPLVAEFSFDYDLPGNGKEDGLEMYPVRTVEGTNRFFKALQSQAGWFDFNTTTKTAFALEVL